MLQLARAIVAALVRPLRDLRIWLRAFCVTFA
jgi:hypothetical protein